MVDRPVRVKMGLLSNAHFSNWVFSAPACIPASKPAPAPFRKRQSLCRSSRSQMELVFGWWEAPTSIDIEFSLKYFFRTQFAAVLYSRKLVDRYRDSDRKLFFRFSSPFANFCLFLKLNFLETIRLSITITIVKRYSLVSVLVDKSKPFGETFGVLGASYGWDSRASITFSFNSFCKKVLLDVNCGLG